MSATIQPARYDYPLWQGSDCVLSLLFYDDADVVITDHTGVTWKLFAYTTSRKLIFSLTGVPDPGGSGVVEFTIPNRARELPIGAHTKYELQRWVGTDQQTLMYGDLVVDGGFNED